MTDNQTTRPLPILRGIGAFATVHFPYSIFTVFLSTILGGLVTSLWHYAPPFFGTIPMFFYALILMVPYFLLGLLMGVFGWSGIQRRWELPLNILTQSTIAWIWAALVLLLMLAIEVSTQAKVPLLGFTFGLMFPLLPITLFLAFPSCLMVLLGATWAGDSIPLLSMAIWAIPAGALPPLLFNLGNYLVSRCKASTAPPPA